MVISVILKGYMPLWLGGIPPAPAVFSNHPSALAHSDFVDAAVAALIAKSSVKQVARDFIRVLNPLGVAVQRAKPRLVLDQRHVNKYLDMAGKKFQLTRICDVSSLLKHGDFLFTLDLESAYHHIELDCKALPFMGFEWKGIFYVFTVLPFGLATAPWVFTKLTRPIVALLNLSGVRVSSYLDDFIGGAPPSDFLDHARRTMSLLVDLGFTLSLPKCDLAPSPSCIWIGFLINTSTMLVSASPSRAADVLTSIGNLVGKKSVQSLDLARFLGRVVSLSPALGKAATFFTRYCQAHMTNLGMLKKGVSVWITLGALAREEIEYWNKNFDKVNGQPLVKPTQHTHVFHSDAGAGGYGGALDSSGALSELFSTGMWDWQICRGYLSGPQRKMSSTAREALALLKCTKAFAPTLRNSVVTAYVDNQALMFAWRKGSMRIDIHENLVRLFRVCEEASIVLNVVWVPRAQNDLADFFSKLPGPGEWRLHRPIFNRLQAKWGPFDVDRFASDQNRQLDTFNSNCACEGSAATNCFSQNWRGVMNWCFPPLDIIDLTLRHMRSSRARGVLVTPFWPSRAWWHIVWDGAKGTFDKSVVKDSDCVFDAQKFRDGLWGGPSDSVFESMVASGNWQGTGTPRFSIFALLLDFS